MELLHVPVERNFSHKCCSAVALLTSQQWCPMRSAEVVLKFYIRSVPLVTALLHTDIELFFEVMNPDVSGQAAWGGEHSSAFGIVAHQLLLSMSC